MSEEGLQPQGVTLDGRYRIIRRIAEGGMATVYEALDERLSREVAIKIMHQQLAQGPHREQFVERFHREVRSAASIASPHIVQVYDSGEYQGRNYLVMEYVRGVNLRYEMNLQSTFSVHETLRIIRETLEGLASAHESGVIHRDIKPENILLNTRGHVQITDFGLAKAVSQATLSTTGMLLGTAAYLAPEMIEHNQATKQGDLYAVGIIAYEMITGAVPFASNNPVTLAFKHVHEDVPQLLQICDGIDPSVSALVKQLCERIPDARPQDAEAALQLLNSCEKQLTPEAGLFTMSAPTQGQSEQILPTVHQQIGVASTLPLNPPAPHPDTTINLNHVQPQANLSETTSESATLSSPNTGIEKQADSKSKRPVILVAILTAVVLLIAGASAAWWYFLGPGSYWSVPQPTDISCNSESVCNISGAEFSKYESTLKISGINYSTSEAFSDTVAKGNIISATPEAVGSHVSKRGGSLQIVISQGIQQATIPSSLLDPNTDVGKKPLEALKAAGFTAITHEENKDEFNLDIPEGAAISVSPKPGSTVNHNAEVTVVLSKGPKPVSMPDVIGETKDSAQQQLQEARLTVTYTEDWSDNIDKGKVISATQQAGAQLHWGDAVSVVVSKGPQTVTMPDVRGQDADEATETLKSLGFEVNISAPLGDLTHTVRLQSPDPGQTVRLRDKNGKATVITLTVV
ncbi:Stk1 family PASTA domain-containing Ser/Thr kinase [Bifidobacterium sp.]|uniref:Stk1 family PASTA domain-containing Ser/Thr kinase n=1 Tax=Bifidobacterium sp. TaxID=41200 RepID=UPI0025BC7367|nr:Stk1 family PASTA domain-containing Ser/Thr kinase [Bifidobacterium sp.]MCI1636016.1 PASTA domain-containing protein [Bifidobacterium sp.]